MVEEDKLASQMLVAAIKANPGLANPTDELLEEVFGTNNKPVVVNKLRKLEKDFPREAVYIREVREGIEQKFSTSSFSGSGMRRLLPRKVEEEIRVSKPINLVKEGDVLNIDIDHYRKGTVINELIKGDLESMGYLELPVNSGNLLLLENDQVSVCPEAYLNPESLHLKALVLLFGLGKKKLNRKNLEVADLLFQRAIEADTLNLSIMYNYCVSLCLVYVDDAKKIRRRKNFDMYSRIVRLLARLEKYIEIIERTQVDLPVPVPNVADVRRVLQGINYVYKRYSGNFLVRLIYMFKMMISEPEFHFLGKTSEIFARLKTREEYLGQIRVLETQELQRQQLLGADRQRLEAYMRMIKKNKDAVSAWINESSMKKGNEAYIEIARKILNHLDRQSGRIKIEASPEKSQAYLVYGVIKTETQQNSVNSSVRTIIDSINEKMNKLTKHWFGTVIETTGTERIVRLSSLDYAVSYAIKAMEVFLHKVEETETPVAEITFKIVTGDWNQGSDSPGVGTSTAFELLGQIPDDVCTPNSIIVTEDVYRGIFPQIKKSFQKIEGSYDMKSGRRIFYRYYAGSDN